MPGGAVGHTARGHADGERATTVPAAQVAARTLGQRRQCRVLRAPRGRRLHDVEGSAEQIGRHDAGGSRADVQAEGEVRLVVDLDGHPRPTDRTGHGEIGAFPQNTGPEQGGDLTIHGGDAEPGGLGDDVAGDGAAQAGRTEDRRCGGFGHPQ